MHQEGETNWREKVVATKEGRKTRKWRHLCKVASKDWLAWKDINHYFVAWIYNRCWMSWTCNMCTKTLRNPSSKWGCKVHCSACKLKNQTVNRNSVITDGFKRISHLLSSTGQQWVLLPCLELSMSFKHLLEYDPNPLLHLFTSHCSLYRRRGRLKSAVSWCILSVNTSHTQL